MFFFKFSKIFKQSSSNFFRNKIFQNFCSRERSKSSRIKEDNNISSGGWLLLIIPASTFGLGCWQVQRRQWKLNLINELKLKTKQKPIVFPNDLDEIKSMEYCPVKVRGIFDHSKEIFLGPRNLLIDGDITTHGSILTSKTNSQNGFHVITPFTLTDRNITILVNRGWIPNEKKNPKFRSNGQINNEIELTGIVRLTEKRNPFMPENKDGIWYYRDLDKMASFTNSEPIYIDANYNSTITDGPIGGQTRVTLRNEHLSYIITWFGLSATTALIWFNYFIRKKR